jgi:precorrin-2 dehydrogenase / sirohydrochlorin ferrochelatase
VPAEAGLPSEPNPNTRGMIRGVTICSEGSIRIHSVPICLSSLPCGIMGLVQFPVFRRTMGDYPIALTGLTRAVVVGAGRVALRKIEGLLACGVEVAVISPVATAAVLSLARKGSIALALRPYVRGDLQGVRLVVAATDDVTVNDAVYREAMERGVLVNVVDDPAHCNFHVPAVVRRGPVTVAISTCGASPYLARLLRRKIARAVGEEYGGLASLLAGWRAWILANVPRDNRAVLWEELAVVLLPLLRRGMSYEARGAGLAIVSKAAGKPTPEAWLLTDEAPCVS